MSRNSIISGAVATLMTASVVVGITACGSSSTTSSVTTTSYAGPGSKWDVDLNSDNTFVITKAASVNAAVDFTVNGTYESLSTGFLKLTVGSVTGTGGPTAGDVAYALDVPGYSFLLKPLDAGSDQLISMVKAGACPTTDIDANWVMVKSNGDPTNAGSDFFGTFNYVVATDSPSLPSKYNLSAFTTVSGGGLSGSGSCADGIMSVTDADMFLTDNGGAIVHIDSGTPADETDDQFVFALARETIGATSIDGDYAGLLFDASVSTSGEKISPVAMTCTSGVCTATMYSNVETGATEVGTATITLTSFDNPSDGFATGTVSDGTSSGNIACMIDTNAAGSGKNIVSCVGQAPAVPHDKMFNVLFVTKS